MAHTIALRVDGNFARAVPEQNVVFLSGVFTDRWGTSSAPPPCSGAVRGCPPTKGLVIFWCNVLFPTAISVSPDLAVLDGSKTLAGTPPKHPWDRGRSRGERHVGPRADSCWPPKRGV